MSDLFFSDHALWFTVPAFVGSAVFILRLLLMFAGGTGLDIHHDVSFDAHGGVGEAHHGDSNDSFKLLSIQSVAAFLMGFGWAGLGVLKGTAWNPILSVPVGVIGGIAMVWLLGLLLKAAYDLQSSGNVPINATVGVDGTVYVTVPQEASGRGQVQVVVNNQQCFFNAITDGPTLVSKTRVRVIGVNDDNTLSVMAI